MHGRGDPGGRRRGTHRVPARRAADTSARSRTPSRSIPNNAIFEPDETNNTRTETTNVTTGIDLVVWKSDNGPTSGDPPTRPERRRPLTEGFDPIATNGTDTYTIIVDNVGTQDSTGIKVRDTLPAGTKFLSVTVRPRASPARTTAPPPAAT